MEDTTPRRSNKLNSGLSFIAPQIMEEFARLVRLLDLSKWIILYVRKSNKKGKAEHGNFLIEQEKLFNLLLSVGIPRERILLLDGDTGKSARLNSRFRADLAKMMELLKEEKVGGVIALNIARLFRDRTLQASSAFAGAMARSEAVLITAEADRWVSKDLRRTADLNWFHSKCTAAAVELDEIRDRTMVSRQNSVCADELTNFSGASVPLGYGVKAGYKARVDGSLVNIAPKIFVYPPHAEYKIAVMQVALLPHIKTYPQLQRHLRDDGMLVPPFDPETAAQSFTRSSLCKVCTGKGAKKRQLPAEANFLPSPNMLRQILLDPLTIGDRLYGSGDDGKFLKTKYEDMAKIMGQTDDSKMNIERIFIGSVPELAICNTPELEQLYYDVCDKWSTLDVHTARESDYEEKLPNKMQWAGVAENGRPPNPENLNSFAGKVSCLLHGCDDDGEPLLDYPMTRNGRGWACMKDNLNARIDGVCSNWGRDNILSKILDAHLRLTAQMIVDGKKELAENMIQAREGDKLRLNILQATIKDLKEDLENQQALAASQRKSFQKAELEGYEGLIDEYVERNVTPVAGNLAVAKREYDQLKDRLNHVQESNSRQEVIDTLQMYLAEDEQPNRKQQMEIVAHMVQKVGVLVSDGFNTRAVYVRFAWANGEIDHLVSWRESSMDNRPWTDDEDAVLDRCWSNKSLSWSDICNQLQPNRKFSSAHRRADMQGLTRKIRRPAAWTDAARESDRNFADNNPDLLYLWLLQDTEEETEVCRMIYTDKLDRAEELEIHEFPKEVSKSLQVLFDETCPVFRPRTNK